MPTKAKLFSVNALAELLERDRRTIGRALRDVKPDGHDAHGAPRWKLPSVVSALNAGNNVDGSADAAADAIEAAAHDVEEMLEQLHEATNIEAARRIAREQGKAVGRLDRALEAGLAGRTPAERGLLEIARNQIVGAATGELLAACKWELPDAGAASEVVR